MKPDELATAVMVFEQPNSAIKYQRMHLPENLSSGEVLVRMNMATICGSDIHTIEGRRKEPVPSILGHEGVGVVIAENNHKSNVKVGDRVTWSIADSCGECVFCAEYNLPQKCINLFKYGHSSITNGTGLNGCYAEHIVIRKGTHIVKVPKNIKDNWVVSANCALATAVNAVSKIPKNSNSVLVQGAGLLGFFAGALLKKAGVSKVYITDINPNRLLPAKQIGLRDILTSEENWKDKITNSNKYGVDAAIEFAGVKEVVSDAVELLRPGGCYVLSGLVHPDSALNVTAEKLIRKCLRIDAIHNYTPQHLDMAVEFLQQEGRFLPFDQLISPPFKLSELNQAVETAKFGRWARVSIDCNNFK